MKYYYQKIYFSSGEDEDKVFCFVVKDDRVVLIKRYTSPFTTSSSHFWYFINVFVIDQARLIWSTNNRTMMKIIVMRNKSMPQGCINQIPITKESLERLFVK